MKQLIYQRHETFRSTSGENLTGEKGRAAMADSPLGPGRKGHPFLYELGNGDVVTLADIRGNGIIRHFFLTVPEMTSQTDPYLLRDLILRMYWDDEEAPSVEVPLGDFFCCGFARGCFVKSEPIVVVPSWGMHCYFPMPFRKAARITLESQHDDTVPIVAYQVDYTLQEEAFSEDLVYFHARWNRENPTQLKRDYTILDGVKGKGHFVGTYLALTTLERYWWGEGEIKVYLDGDTQYPTIAGTGSEDYFGGAFSFAKQKEGRTVEQTFCTPYFGYPYYSRTDASVFNYFHNDDMPPERGLYRFHLQDAISFQEDIRVTIQQIGVSHGGLFERQDDVSSVAYWYQTEPHIPVPHTPEKKERWPR